MPHITIVKAPSEEDLDRIEQEAGRALLPELPWVITIREIPLDEERLDATWRTRYAIPLAAQT